MQLWCFIDRINAIAESGGYVVQVAVADGLYSRNTLQHLRFGLGKFLQGIITFLLNTDAALQAAYLALHRLQQFCAIGISVFLPGKFSIAFPIPDTVWQRCAFKYCAVNII